MAKISRRGMLQGVAGAVGAGYAMTSGASRALETTGLELKRGGTVLFQGDSITDTGRDRSKGAQPNDTGALGQGYARLLAHELLRDYPAHDLRIFNRGISGNKVPDLAARWQEDCVALQPDVLSILIGVNDVWHKLDGRYDGTVEDYASGFAALLARTRDALPDTRLVVCEPFVLRCGAVDERWFPEFDERRAAARSVAYEAGGTMVPFQRVFDDAVARGTEPEYWAADGVHPSMAGHALMATAWRAHTDL